MPIPRGAALDLHPVYQNARHTMQGLFTERDAAVRAAERMARTKGKVTIRYELSAPGGRLLHAVAAREMVVPVRRISLPHDHSAPWEAVRIALEMFRRAEKAAKKRGAPLRWYKQLEVDKLRRVMQQYAWSGSRLDVAAGILSRTIVAHPFPNANHRTSISIARRYLKKEGIDWPPYSLRGRGIQRFIRETEDHIIRSKYLLQLRRRMPLVRVAHEHGFTALQIKTGFTHVIEPRDLLLTVDQAIAKHDAACRALIASLDGGESEQALARSGRTGLREFAAPMQDA